MEAEVQELLDKQALYELVVRYCRAVDRADPELLLSIYHEDAIDEHGPMGGTPQQFLESLSQGTMNIEKRPLPVQHAVSNCLFEIHGDVAYGEAYAEVRRVDDEGRMFVEGFARFADRFERRGGVWKFVHRRALLEYAGGPGGRHAFDEWLTGTRDRTDPTYERDAEHLPPAGIAFAGT